MDPVSIRQLDIRTKKIFELLLKESQPSRDRKYALLKLLMQEESPLSREDLNDAITSFYSLSYERRTARQFRRTFSVKPYPWLLTQFNLSFRNAFISEAKIFKTASSLQYLIRNVIEVPNDISSVDTLHLAVHRLTKPRVDQVAASIGFPTLSYRWRDASFFKFGNQFEGFFDELDKAIEQAENYRDNIDSGFFSLSDESDDRDHHEPDITQTDLDWFKAILTALEDNLRPPLYPLQRGPQTPVLLRLEKLVRAAHLSFPIRHSQLESAVRRSCLYYLKRYNQEPRVNVSA